jgi:invasion protein IalB
MLIRTIACLAALFSASAALAQQAAAPAAAPAQQQRPRNPNAPNLTETQGDWTIRCFNVRGPAPCEILQVAVNKESQQRVLSVSIAYVPQRTAFALQVAVPLGVSVAKGMTLNAGPKTMRGVHYSRCTRDGCFVEVIVDSATIDALARVGASTNILVYPYGRTTDAKLPLSLKGFAPAVVRLKQLAQQRAVATPAGQQGAAPAPAAPARPAPAPAPAPTPTP